MTRRSRTKPRRVPLPRHCVCDGRYDGCDHTPPCPATPGGHLSEFFCAACDHRRCDHISANLKAIADGLNQSGGAR